MGKANPLEFSFSILLKVEKKEGYINILLNKVFADFGASGKPGDYSNLTYPSDNSLNASLRHLDSRDKAFIKRLCEGCLEKLYLLDYIGDKYSKQPIAKQKPAIRVILRMGIYQLLFMDSVPGHAAVNECVKLAKAHKFNALSGFVNGLLRNVSANKDALLEKIRGLYLKEDEKSLSICYSVPLWIIKMWIRDYKGMDIKALLKAIRTPRPLCIRISPGHLDEREDICRELCANGATISEDESDTAFSTCEDKDLSCGQPLRNDEGFPAGAPSPKELIRVRYLRDIGSLNPFRRGLITVQDESSVRAVYALGIKTGDSVIDVCAAPGGKSILASQLAGPDGRVVSMDISVDKFPLMEAYIHRMKLSNITLKCHDATVTEPSFAGKFDALICDVPCSGLGVIGRKKDICYRVKEEDISELAKISNDIVKASLPYLRGGGRLLFSTCTISRAENEAVAGRIELELPLKCLYKKQLLPHIDNTDGFFFSVFEKRV